MPRLEPHPAHSNKFRFLPSPQGNLLAQLSRPNQPSLILASGDLFFYLRLSMIASWWQIELKSKPSRFGMQHRLKFSCNTESGQTSHRPPPLAFKDLLHPNAFVLRFPRKLQGISRGSILVASRGKLID